jgi:hypothetical protein
MKVYESFQPLSPEQVLALPRESRETDWHNNALPTPFAWSVALDPSAFWFVCALPGGGRSASLRGAFVEGLWEEDVAELFIKSPSGVYQELNIAPSGAWWSMTLDEYRVRRESPRRPEVLYISTSINHEQWRHVAAFSRSSLEVPVTPRSTMHVSGMWHRTTPCFLSSRPPPGVDPDYHHPGCFESVLMTEWPGSC